MSTNLVFNAGLEGKSDIQVSIDASVPELNVKVESSVIRLFGRQIMEKAESTLRELGVNRGNILLKDDGALDHVIAARIEAASRKANLAPLPRLTSPTREMAVKDRLRRSRMYIPGNQPDLMTNAGLFGADSYILDLEDSVSPDQKLDARVLVRRTLQNANLFFEKTEIIVRINPLSGPFGKDDLAEIVPMLPHVILIPKCDSPEDVAQAEEIVGKIEKSHQIAGRILFMPLIETVKGIVNSARIAAASPRNVALCFGAEDFTRDMGVTRTREGRETLQARAQMVWAAKAAGIQAIDTVFSDVGDDEGLFNSSLEAKSLGFVGKGVIHPRQIPIVHRAFAPTEAEIEEAKKIVEALRKAEQAGSGVVALGSKMVDAPVAERARKVIALAKQIGVPGMENL